MLEKIQNILLFAGVDRLNYDLVKTKVANVNRTVITVFSGIASILLALFYVLTFFIEVMRHNRPIYELGLIFSVILFVTSKFIAKRYAKLVAMLVHLAIAIFYIYGILIGTVVSPNHASVTFMVMLVFMPMLFINRPAHSIIMNLFYAIIFIVLCYRNKSMDLIPTDVVNVITFSILGTISGIIVSHIKVRGYVVEQMLHKISRFDQMTQMNNRNAYELERISIPYEARCTLACIYIDVNDLHVLNNTKGHDYGDEMLKYVARQIKKFFGDKYSYRIGGDEFIAFALDVSDWEVTQKTTELKRVCEEKGYHIAVGSKRKEVRNIDLEGLIKDAELEMYREKDLYHEEHNSESRN